jgi:hypothetical protein
MRGSDMLDLSHGHEKKLRRRADIATLHSGPLIEYCECRPGVKTCLATGASIGYAARMLRPSPRFFAAALTLLGAVVFTSASCGGGESSSGSAATSTGTNGKGGAGQGGDGEGGFVSAGGNGQGGSGGACEPPDVLVSLDRTLTMHYMPDGTKPVDGPDDKSSKWYQAVSAV